MLKAETLLDSIKVLEKLKQKQDEQAKVNERFSKEIGELVSQLPPALRELVKDDGKGEEKRERITISNEQKKQIGEVAKEIVKKAKDGIKFGDIMTKAQKELLAIRFKDTHLRGIMQNDKAFKMKGEKKNAMWFYNG